MISKQELIDLANEFSLGVETVEKDYVLGWLLAGIANHPDLFDQWIFKGGTCLKKCYFETYRFSEDLDYTLINKANLDEQFLLVRFNQIAEWIYENSGIEIPADRIRFEIYQNSNGKISCEGRVYYIGPLKRRGSNARIKLDLTADEILVLPSVQREVHHPYSDKPQNGILAHCYNFYEVFAEKVRALSERTRPRDLYDVIHLYRHTALNNTPILILDVLKKKCEYKKIPLPTVKDIDTPLKSNELNSGWSNMLAHQLPILPPVDEFWQELPNVFDWLYGENITLPGNSIPQNFSDDIDHSWHPPSMIQAWHMNVPIELIRYAGANQLCLEIGYNNKVRLIEPYNLQKTQAGYLVLKAIEQNANEWKSFRLDRIQKLQVTKISFKPQAAILLTPFVGISAQPTSSKHTPDSISTYICQVQCPVCNKNFPRSKFDTKLYPHKDSYGRRCPGRRGFII